MEYQTKVNIIGFSLIIGIFLTAFTIANVQQMIRDAAATGGAGEIKGLIDPIIERAITALQQNNTELALEEIQTLKEELDDTFEQDKD